MSFTEIELELFPIDKCRCDCVDAFDCAVLIPTMQQNLSRHRIIDVDYELVEDPDTHPELTHCESNTLLLTNPISEQSK